MIDLSKRFHVVDKTLNSSSRDDKSTNTRILKYTNKEMSEKKWFECIAQDKTWIRDALQSLSVVGHDKRWIKNPIRALFAPILNDQIKIAKDEIVLCRDQIERVRLAYTATKKSNNILATLFFKNKNTFMNLNFESNNKSYIPLRFCLENEEKRSMKLFYAKIWKVEDLLKKQENTSTFVVHQDHVERFCKTISSKKILPSVRFCFGFDSQFLLPKIINFTGTNGLPHRRCVATHCFVFAQTRHAFHAETRTSLERVRMDV